MDKDKTQYTSSLTTLLTLVGVAVGLGNVWRFPYMMGSYGGSAFLAVYLLFTLLFALPALMVEMTLGRMSGKGTIDAFRIAFGNRFGSTIGYLLLIVITISGSYYVVVVANVIYTTGYSIISGFDVDTIQNYSHLLSSSLIQYSIVILLIISCLYVLHKGLINGIEWLSRIIMPFFVFALLYMILHAFSLPNAMEKVRLFLSPNFSALGSTEIFAALGQAFFSIGLGGTFVVVYAGYIKKEQSIPKMAMLTGLGDVSASLLVSLFLVPSILVFGLDMASGPGLIFNTLPQLFATMPSGRVVGSLFLLSLSLVAFLSLIAAYQVPYVSIKNEKPNVKPERILITLGVVQAILAFPSTLSPAIIGFLDLIFGSGMQIFGSVLCVLGLTWGLQKGKIERKMFLNSNSPGANKFVIFWIKWIIPVVLILVLLGYIFDSI